MQPRSSTAHDLVSVGETQHLHFSGVLTLMKPKIMDVLVKNALTIEKVGAINTNIAARACLRGSVISWICCPKPNLVPTDTSDVHTTAKTCNSVLPLSLVVLICTYTQPANMQQSSIPSDVVVILSRVKTREQMKNIENAHKVQPTTLRIYR